MQYRLQATYRRRVTRAYLRLPMSWHQAHPTGELLSNANADVEAAWWPIAPLPMAVGVVVMVIGALAFLVSTDPVLALVGCVVFPGVAILNVVYSRRLAPLMARAQQLRAEVSGVAHPYAEAHIQKHVASAQKPQGQHPSTVAFLVRVDSLPGVEDTPGLPCGLLACFGMDGYSTLIWNRVVRLRYPQFLAQPGFLMAELVFKKPIPRRPLTPEFAGDLGYLEVKLLTKG